MRTLKILGYLLTYPNVALVQSMPEMRKILADEKWLDPKSMDEIEKLMFHMEQTELLDLQEDYVALFDRTPSLCLHLFEHVHGDSRDRGQALVDLSEVYKDAGLLLNAEELPDYLPMFLEYLSIINIEDACENLGEIVNVLGVLSGRLDHRESPYACVFDALIYAASKKPDMAEVEKAILDENGEVRSFDEIDEAWEEQFAFDNSLQTTGQDMQDGCPQAAEMLARMNIPEQKKEA